MRTPAGILAARHYPLVALLLQVILDRHALCGIAAFGRDGDGGIGLAAVDLNGRQVDVHAFDIQPGLGQMVDNSLTHRVIILGAVMTSGEREDQQQSGADSHDLIIHAVL